MRLAGQAARCAHCAAHCPQPAPPRGSPSPMRGQEDCKHLCRKFVHKILAKEHGNTRVTASTPVKVGKYVKQYFDKHVAYKPEAGNDQPVKY